MALIDDQQAIEAIEKAFDRETILNRFVRKVAIDAVKALPSVQSEIIMCKDCKYVGYDATCCMVCNREGMGLKPYHVYHDDFCSYAERRTDGSD